MHASRPFRFSLLAAALVLAGAAAAAPAKQGPLDGMSKTFEDFIRSGDVVGAANLYADDGMILPPNVAAVSGRGNIAAFFKTMTDNGFSLKLTPTDSWMDGKLAVRTGTYIVVDKTQKEIEHGKWLEAWKQNSSGRWQLVRDIWNSSDPPPAPPPATGMDGDKK